MDFAKSVLLKYGWTEGKGLGKSETGITVPLKPHIKLDTTGIGHDHADTFTNHWWERAFNSVADNISISKDDDGTVSLKTKNEFEITTKKISSQKRKHLLYNNFMKTSLLTNEGTIVQLENDISEIVEVNKESEVKVPELTDEELFKACGGRTAHKGARHGLGLSGKLARIEEHERQVILLQNSTKELLQNQEKKSKKKKARECTLKHEPIQDISLEAGVSKKKSKEIKRKKNLEEEVVEKCKKNKRNEPTSYP